MLNQKLHWTIREKHEMDYNKLLKYLGWMNDKGFIFKFDSRIFREEWGKLGHDSTILEKCKCSR